VTTAQRARAAAATVFDGPCVTCHVSPGRRRGTRLSTVVCGPCWAAHGGKPGADEIGPEPALTAPLRCPSGQRHWYAALGRAEWVQDIRVDGRQHLLLIARVLARHADWTTLESWPGWDTLMARTGLSETTVQRWLQELKLRGWVVVLETGSTPLTRPMALRGPLTGGGRDGEPATVGGQLAGVATLLRGQVEGNRRAVYGLRIPLTPAEATVWVAEQITRQAAQETAESARQAAAQARAKVVARVRGLLAKAGATAFDCERAALLAKADQLRAEHRIGLAELTDPDVAAAGQRRQEAEEFVEAMADPEVAAAYARILHDLETAPDQKEPALFGDKKGWPTWSSRSSEKTKLGGYAREARVVDDLGQPPADPWGNTPNDALRARFEDKRGLDWAAKVPTSGFEMLVAADWLRRRLPILGKLTRKAVRALVRPYWAAGWANVDVVHALDHLPSAFGARAGTPIGRGPADGLDRMSTWTWVKTRLEAWRTPAGEVRTGYFQTRGRRQAIKKALVSRHGRAAARVLRDEDLAADVTLTPEHIAAFGRRVADQLRDAAPARPAEPATPSSSAQTRAAAAAQVHDTVVDNRLRRAEHQVLREQLADQLAEGRRRLAEATGATDARPVPVAPAQDDLTPMERWERARAMGSGGNRARRRRGGLR
jgi:hypothetical protein